MSPSECLTKAGFIFCLFCTIQLQTGCMAASALKGKQGDINVSNVKTGISRTEVEDILGPPRGEWITSLGIRYCVYTYDPGVPPSAWEAAGIVMLDVISAGMFELVEATAPQTEYRIKKIAVSYDIHGVVVGVFNPFEDFDELPPDGCGRK